MNYFTPKTLAAKLNQIEIDKINDNYEKLAGTTKKMTFKQFFLTILNTALSQNERGSNALALENRQLSERIRILTDGMKQRDQKIIELTEKEETRVDTNEQEKQKLREIITDKDDRLGKNAFNYEGKINTLNDRIKELEGIIDNTPPPEQPPRDTNTLLIDLPPTIAPFLSLCTQEECRRMDREIKPGEILINLFWKQIKDGPGDHLPKVFSNKQIRDIIKGVESANE